MVSEKYSRIDVLRKRRLFPSRGLAAAMENLAENLGKLSVMNEVCEDDTIVHEYNKIMNTIRRVSNNLQNRCK
jgi:hypothetical protein